MLATRLNRLPTVTLSRLRALKIYCPRSCIFCNLGHDSDIKYIHCPLYHIHTVGILAVVCVHVCASEVPGLCGLFTALQQPYASIYSLPGASFNLKCAFDCQIKYKTVSITELHSAWRKTSGAPLSPEKWMPQRNNCYWKTKSFKCRT